MKAKKQTKNTGEQEKKAALQEQRAKLPPNSCIARAML